MDVVLRSWQLHLEVWVLGSELDLLERNGLSLYIGPDTEHNVIGFAGNVDFRLLVLVELPVWVQLLLFLELLKGVLSVLLDMSQGEG